MYPRRRLRGLVAGVAFAAAAVLFTSGCAATETTGGGDAEGPIKFGISGPLTGEQAQYGKDWQLGFDLYLEQINADGGVDGREVEIVFEDSQNDPSQATTIAQKFVSDDEILAVIGDFSSSTSTVASPLYQRGGILQLGITNSAPAFTDTGDYIFSPSVTAQVDATLTENLASKISKKVAVIFTNTDYGKSFADIVAESSEKSGSEIVLSQGVDESSTDFTPVLLRVKDSGAESVIFATYYRTTSLLAQQSRAIGLDAEIVAIGANYSNEFLELAGDAAEGVHTLVTFFADDTRDEVTDFVSAFRKKYDQEPNQFNAMAYDGLRQLVWAFENSDGSRTGIRDALRDGKDIPSVVLGDFSYGPDRRINQPVLTHLVVRDGSFVRAE